MTAEFIAPGDPRWAGFLARVPHDVYHLAEYTAFAAGQEGGVPVAFYAEEEDRAFLVPLLLRKVPDYLEGLEDWQDATTPYGYPSPLTTAADDPEILARFLKAFQAAARERQIVTAFLRLHPLLALPGKTLARHGVLVKHGSTVYVDCSQPLEAIWAQTRYNHRTGIRRLAEAGFQAKMDDWRFFDAFIAVYRDTMARVSAGSTYLFSDRYFGELRTALGDRLHLCAILSPEQKVAVAGLFTAVGDIVQFHLSGTAQEYIRHAPSKLMHDFMRRWAKEQGYRVFHLGGGVGGRADSLFQFKAGFSRLTADFFTYRMVLDDSAYAALARRWKERHGSAEGGGSDFFPIYRCPLA